MTASVYVCHTHALLNIDNLYRGYVKFLATL